MPVLENYLEKRLQEWALWYTRQIDVGTGYPERSLESRLQDEVTFMPSKGRHYQNIPYSPTAIEIEKLIVELAQYNALLANALRADYIQPGTQHNKAASLGISLAQFKFCTKLAKMWLHGRFSAVMASMFYSKQAQR